MTAKEFNTLLQTYKSDPISVEKLYNYYFPRISARLQEIYDVSVAEDAVNEFFIRLFVATPTYYITCPALWVYGEAEKIAAEKGVKRIPEKLSEVGRILATYKFDDLYKSIEQVDETSYAILELSYLDGFKQQKIAELMNLSYDAVRQKHSRAARKLRRLLGINTEK